MDIHPRAPPGGILAFSREEPRPQVEASSKEKANYNWGLYTLKSTINIHPRAQPGGILAFSRKLKLSMSTDMC